jgi:hypothetical protein
VTRVASNITVLEENFILYVFGLSRSRIEGASQHDIGHQGVSAQFIRLILQLITTFIKARLDFSGIAYTVSWEGETTGLYTGSYKCR